MDEKKLINMSELANKEDKLMDVCEYLEELQPIMEDIISDYEFEGADKEKVTDLETALSHLYKAQDLVNEIVAEDLYPPMPEE